MIGDSDRCIGATALHHHLPLLTNSRRHFDFLLALGPVVEMLALPVAFAGVGQLVFGSLGRLLPLEAAYLFVPLLIWTALRYGPPGVAAAHADPTKGALLREMQQHYPLDPARPHAILAVLHTSRSRLDPTMAEAALAAAARDAEQLHLFRELGVHAVMIVPLVARGRTLGAMSSVAAAARRRYAPADLAPAEALAGRCAIAVDNARLYRDAQEAIRTREESLAPLDTLLASAPVGLGCFDRELRLEQRVQERTAALGHAVDNLRREIAGRQRAEAQLHRQQEALAQREKLAAMGSLLASVAHELTNPLAVVMMHADLLREDVPEGPPAMQAQALILAAERCGRIVPNFLTLARAPPPARVPVQLNPLVQEAPELVRYPLQVDTMEVALHLAETLPPSGPIRPRCSQSSSICSPMPATRCARAPPRRLTLTTRADLTRSRVILEVADTGPGIPPTFGSGSSSPFSPPSPPAWGRRFLFLTGDTVSPESRSLLERAGLPRLMKPFTAAEASSGSSGFGRLERWQWQRRGALWSIPPFGRLRPAELSRDRTGSDGEGATTSHDIDALARMLYSPLPEPTTTGTVGDAEIEYAVADCLSDACLLAGLAELGTMIVGKALDGYLYGWRRRYSHLEDMIGHAQAALSIDAGGAGNGLLRCSRWRPRSPRRRLPN